MLTRLILCFIALGSVLLSCQKDDNESSQAKGSLTINVGLFISVNEEPNTLKSVQGVEDFMVVIYNLSGQAVQTFQRYAEMPSQIELEAGQYYVVAHSNNDLAAAFDNPYYYGESDDFAITPGVEQTATVNCELANTMVTIVYSDMLRSSYTDFTTTVSSSAGSLTFTAQETRPGYFQPLPLSIVVLLSWRNGEGVMETKTLTGSIPDPQPRKKYEVHIDAMAPQGSSMVMINIIDNAEPPEIIQITDQPAPLPGTIPAGAVIISEIMYNPTALDDSQGEWFEVYNTTNSPIDLNQAVIRKNENESHTINETLVVPPLGYIVLSRTQAAFSGTAYVYGTSIALNNTAATLALNNPGVNGTEGQVICAINYTSENFPRAAGASISLSPLMMTGTSAVLGTSWCISGSVFHTGDAGTPAAENDACQ